MLGSARFEVQLVGVIFYLKILKMYYSFILISIRVSWRIAINLGFVLGFGAQIRYFAKNLDFLVRKHASLARKSNKFKR